MSDKEPKNRYGITIEKLMGRPRSYTPEEWGAKFIEYLEARGVKVWNKHEGIRGGEMAGTTVKVPHEMPLSIESFCVFAGVHKQTFYNYESDKDNEPYSNYFDITTHIREVIESDQIDGATVGAYNPSIIAKRLGLMDKVDYTSGGDKIDNHVTFDIVKTVKKKKSEG